MLMGLLCGGHILVEGAPGLAKTRAIKALATVIEGDFHRIQFTPDLLPSDVTGTEIYRPEDGSFNFQPGPIFHNLILADEINRAPARCSLPYWKQWKNARLHWAKRHSHSKTPIWC